MTTSGWSLFHPEMNEMNMIMTLAPTSRQVSCLCSAKFIIDTDSYGNCPFFAMRQTYELAIMMTMLILLVMMMKKMIMMMMMTSVDATSVSIVLTL